MFTESLACCRDDLKVHGPVLAPPLPLIHTIPNEPYSMLQDLQPVNTMVLKCADLHPFKDRFVRFQVNECLEQKRVFQSERKQMRRREDRKPPLG